MKKFLFGTVAFASVISGVFAVSACAPRQTVNDTASSQASNGRYSENDMSPQLRQFRDKWFAVSTPQEIHSLLTELEKEASSAPADLKIFAQRFVGLKDIRGMHWRLEKLADDSRAINSLFITTALDVRKGVDVFAPLKNWKALHTYLSEPLDMAGEAKFSQAFPQFTTVAQLQAELVGKLVPKFIERTKIIESTPVSDSKPLVWDNSLAWGKDSFSDSLDRFAVYGNNEKTAELAGRHMVIHNALVFAAWNLNDFGSLSAKLGKLYGIDGFLFQQENGVTDKEKGAVLRQFPNFGTLVNRALLPQALAHLRTSVSLARKSWNSIKNSSGNEYAPLNPAFLKPFHRATENTLATVERALKGPTAMRSRITGEVVEVNVPAMYENPPADLKVFLPTAYHGGSLFMANSSGYQVRNTLYGSANAWNVGSFAPYFPGVKNSQELEMAERVLASSWAGGPIAGLLANTIF